MVDILQKKKKENSRLNCILSRVIHWDHANKSG